MRAFLTYQFTRIIQSLHELDDCEVCVTVGYKYVFSWSLSPNDNQTNTKFEGIPFEHSLDVVFTRIGLSIYVRQYRWMKMMKMTCQKYQTNCERTPLIINGWNMYFFYYQSRGMCKTHTSVNCDLVREGGGLRTEMNQYSPAGHLPYYCTWII